MPVASHSSETFGPEPADVHCGTLLDAQVRKLVLILRFPALDATKQLLVWRYTLLVMDLRLDVVDRVAGLHVELDCIARAHFHVMDEDEDLHRR